VCAANSSVWRSQGAVGQALPIAPAWSGSSVAPRAAAAFEAHKAQSPACWWAAVGAVAAQWVPGWQIQSSIPQLRADVKIKIKLKKEGEEKSGNSTVVPAAVGH